MPSVHCISRKLLKKNGLERLPWDVGGAPTQQQLLQQTSVDAPTDLLQHQHINTKHIHELEAELSTTIDSNKKKLSAIVVDSSAAQQVSQPQQLDQEDANLSSKASPTKSVEEDAKKKTKHMSPIALRALAALNSDSDSSSSEEEDMEIDKPAQKGLDAAEIENLATGGEDEVGEYTSPSQIMIPSLPPLPVVPSPGYNVADDTAQLDNIRGEMKNEETHVYSLSDKEEDGKKPVKKRRRALDVVSFQHRLDELKAYKAVHGHTKVKKSEDKRLFMFCHNIRYAHNHPDKSSVVMNNERIASLDALGFEWVKETTPISFEQRVEDLKAYKLKHGHLNLKRSDDPSLYNFCCNIKTARNNPSGTKGMKVTEERIASLDAIGFEWAAKDHTRTSFQQRLGDLKAYKLKHGHLNVRKEEDPSLYNFCNNMKTARNNPSGTRVNVSEERIASLDAIGFEWAAKDHTRTSFQQRLGDLKAYKLKHGHLNVKRDDDPSLYNFCNSIRTSRNNTGKPGTKKLTEERIVSLDTIGFDWGNKKKSSGQKELKSDSLSDGEEDVKSTREPAKKRKRALDASVVKKKRTRVSFQQRIDELKAYKDEHGHMNVKRSENKSLYDFCNNIKHAHKHPDAKKRLTEDRIASLNAVGFDWTVKEQVATISFEQRLEDLKTYKKKHGHLNLKREDNPSLYNFCINIRNSRNKSDRMKVTEERIASLDALGFDWEQKTKTSTSRVSFQQRLVDFDWREKKSSRQEELVKEMMTMS